MKRVAPAIALVMASLAVLDGGWERAQAWLLLGILVIVWDHS